MGNQPTQSAFTCSCGRHYEIVPLPIAIGARSIDSRGRSSAVTWQSSGGQGSQGQSFEQSVVSAFPWLGSGKGQNAPSDAGALSPGESWTAKMYRPRSKADVSIPLLANIVSGGIVLAITLTTSLAMRFSELVISPFWLRQCQWWIGRRWYLVTSIAFLTTIAWIWFKVQLPDLLDDDKLITSVQEHERHPEPAPIEIKPPAVSLEFNERNEQGRIERQVRATLSAPKGNHDGLWQYCKALAVGQAFPSLEGGKSGPGAQAFGYTDGELDAWRKETERAGLLEAPRSPRQPWTITERGKGAFARIGQQRLREASYGV